MELPQDLLLEVVLVHLPVTGRGKQRNAMIELFCTSQICMYLALEHERKWHVNNNVIPVDPCRHLHYRLQRYPDL